MLRTVGGPNRWSVYPMSSTIARMKTVVFIKNWPVKKPSLAMGRMAIGPKKPGENWLSCWKRRMSRRLKIIQLTPTTMALSLTEGCPLLSAFCITNEARDSETR